MSEERCIKDLIFTPEMILHLLRRFSVERIPEDLAIREVKPTIRLLVTSKEFDSIPVHIPFPKWYPALDITRTKVDDAIDEIKSGLDLLIDAEPVDVQGSDLHEQSRNHFAQALAFLTERVETGGEHGKT